MRKMLALALLLGAMAAQVSAQQHNTHTLADGSYLSPTDSPCNLFRVGTTSGTLEVTGFGTDGTDTRGWINWIQLSTGPVNSFLVLIDTNKVRAAREDTDKVIMSQLNFVHSGALDTNRAGRVEFRPPMQFTRGVKAFKSEATSTAIICGRLSQTQIP